MADEVTRDFSLPRFNLEKVSWGAIWAGVMVTIGMEALFLAFGIFIAALIGGSTIWTYIWYLVTMAVSFYAGASTAARLSDVVSRDIRVLHGLATWGLATLATVLIGGVVVGIAGYVALTQTNAAAYATGAMQNGSVWGPLEQNAGIIWGGMMLSLMTAYLGGATGTPVQRTISEQRQTPTEPLRRAG